MKEKLILITTMFLVSCLSIAATDRVSSKVADLRPQIEEDESSILETERSPSILEDENDLYDLQESDESVAKSFEESESVEDLDEEVETDIIKKKQAAIQKKHWWQFWKW